MVMIKPRDRQMTSYPFRFHCWATDLCTHVSAVPICFRPHMSHILSWVFVSNGHGKAKRSADDVTSFQVSSRYRPLCTHTRLLCMSPSSMSRIHGVWECLFSLSVCVYMHTLLFGCWGLFTLFASYRGSWCCLFSMPVLGLLVTLFLWYSVLMFYDVKRGNNSSSLIELTIGSLSGLEVGRSVNKSTLLLQ